MSAKQVRKLQALRQTENCDEESEESEEKPMKGKVSTFAALLGEESEEDAEPKLNTAGPEAEPKPGPAKKKKKKKGKKQESKQVEADEDDGDKLLDAALAEAAASQAAPEPNTSGVSSCALVISKNSFNAEKERSRLFQERLLKPRRGTSAVGMRPRGAHEGHFVHYRRLFLVVPTSEGWPRPEGCARMAAEDSGLFRIESTPEHARIRLELAQCALLHDPAAIRDFLAEFPFSVEALCAYAEVARQANEHQHAFDLLRRAVYAVDCCFEAGFAPFAESSQRVARGEGSDCVAWPRARLRQEEEPAWQGWAWLCALLSYMLHLAFQGLPRTALEVCKLLLVMTLPKDPLHALAHLEILALKAEDYEQLLSVSERFNPPWDLPANAILRLDCCLPNFAYAAALAHFLRAKTKDGDETALSTVSVEDLTGPYWAPVASREDGPSRPHLALMRAMLLFPQTVRDILTALGVSLSVPVLGSAGKLSWAELLERSPLAGKWHVGHKKHILAHALISDAFVRRGAPFFRPERALRWLHSCASRLTQMCESPLFQQELLDARRAWSESQLAVDLALRDYQSFNAAEVEGKLPTLLERAMNSWLGDGLPLPHPGPQGDGPAPGAGYAAPEAEALERRLLVEEQDAEYRQSLAMDNAREQLAAMGFEPGAASEALLASGGDVERAVLRLTESE